MKNLRFAAAALLLFSTAQAWAFRGRPVSDLRFEGRARLESPNKAAASDGTDFLVLTTAGNSLENSVVVQKVVDGAPAGPQRLLDRGDARSLTWTGSHYLAAWQRGQTLWTAPLSREGTLLAEPQSVAEGFFCGLAVGPSSALAFCYGSRSSVRPLDLTGRPAGNAIWSNPLRPNRGLTVAPAAGGRFAGVLAEQDGFVAMLFNADGTPAGPPIRYDDAESTSFAIATDGADTLIAYTKPGPQGRQLKTAVLAANGALKRTSVVLATEARIRGIARDGAGYAVLLQETPLLIRITAEGARSGDPVPVPSEEDPPRRGALALASNSQAFLVVLQPDTAVILDAATMQPVPMSLGRTLSTQDLLTIEAGPAGYLAAWLEVDEGVRTVRASRIDAAGHYLDGPGLILDTVQGLERYTVEPIDYIRIDASGPSWTVSWTNRRRIRAATVSYGGVAGETLTLGDGYAADLLRDGPHYLVLRAHDLTVYLDRITPDGTVVETRELLPWDSTLQYAEPTLIRLGGRPVALVTRLRQMCRDDQQWDCPLDVNLLAVRLDEPSAAPVVFGTNLYGYISVATGGERAVVMSPALGGSMFAAILSAGNLAVTPFPFATQVWGVPALAFDGRDFVVFTSWDGRTLTARISASGSVTGATVIPNQHPHHAAALAASPTLPPLAGFEGRHPSYDNVSRADVLFIDEFDDQPTPPPAPSILCAARDAAGTISVRWQPVPDILGISIELQLPDGTYRQIGVAAGNAGSARVSTAGLLGSTVRVRAWNEGGLSAPSAAAPSVVQPEVNVRTSLKTCAGVPVAVGFTLSGIAPFTVRWSDGVVQTNLMSSATRTVTLTRDTTLTIVSVADAGCAINDTRRSIRIVVDPAAKIAAQPAEVRVARGQSTTLTITANDATSYEWFEGAAGNTSRPVDGNGGSFTTPALFASTRYWVRVANRCGAASSQAIAVTVAGKSRAVRR